MSKNGNNGTTATSGIGFVGLLQIAFIILKLCKVIAWSWWAVLLPTIISTGIVIIAILAIIIVAFCRKY